MTDCSFTLGDRKMTVMSSTADSWFLILTLYFLVNIFTCPLSFCPSVLSLWGSFSPPSLPLLSCPFTLVSELSLLSHKKTKVFLMKKTKKGSPAVPKFALRNYSFVVVVENQRWIQTCLLLPPINCAGFLAAVPGSSEDNADLGKRPLFLLLTYWDGSVPETTTEISSRLPHKTDLW